jgi:hypothetical protein
VIFLEKELTRKNVLKRRNTAKSSHSDHWKGLRGAR